jgi:DNA-binding beta-propeller fold protein YncE
MLAEESINMANTCVLPERLAPHQTEAPAAQILGAEVGDPDAAVLSGIGVFRGPIGDIAAGPGVIVVTNFGDNSVSVLSADNPAEHLTVDATVALGGEPFAVAVAGRHAYVCTTSEACDFVSAIDTASRSVVATYPLALRVAGLAVDRDGNRVFVGTTGPDVADLAIIDTTTDRISAVEISSDAGAVADAVRVSPDGRLVYVAVSDAHRGDLVAVDADQGRVTARVRGGSPIRDIAVSPDGGAVYVLTHDPRRGEALDVLDVRDTATCQIVGRVALDGAHTQLALSADGARAYVVGPDDVAVVCTSTNQIVDTINVGAPPSCVAAGPDGTEFYIADYEGVVTVVAPIAVTSDARSDVPSDVTGLLDQLPDVRELQPV